MFLTKSDLATRLSPSSFTGGRAHLINEISKFFAVGITTETADKILADYEAGRINQSC